MDNDAVFVLTAVLNVVMLPAVAVDKLAVAVCAVSTDASALVLLVLIVAVKLAKLLAVAVDNEAVAVCAV